MSPEEKKNIEQAYEKESGRLLRFIRSRIPDEEEAKDILQDVFSQLISFTGEIRTIKNLTAWLFTVTRRKIIDRSRKKKPDLFSDKQISTGSGEEEGVLMLEDILPSLTLDPEDEFMRSVILDAIEEVLEELPFEQREVFILHEFEERSFKEIANMTGQSINTLISRKHYAVLYLRDRLFDLYNQLNF
jgi:RNA polymerase sigma factor (sigma-70 family)